MRYPNAFIDPATSTRWEWPMNHAPDGEEEHGEAVELESSATTSGTGVTRQQGAVSRGRLVRRGQILRPDQHAAMVEWARLGRQQTIYFEDFTGDTYEVLVTAFRTAKVGVTHNSFGTGPSSLHKWTFTLEMEVIQALAGSWS